MANIIAFAIIRMLWLGLTNAEDHYYERITNTTSGWKRAWLRVDWVLFKCSGAAVGILGFILTMFAMNAVYEFFKNHNDEP